MKVEEIKKLNNEGKATIAVRWSNGPDGTSARIRELMEDKKDEVFSYDALIDLTGKKRKNLTSILQYLINRKYVGRIYIDDQPYFGSVTTVEKLLKEELKQK